MLEASTTAGKVYNAIILWAILLSVLALLFEPDPLGIRPFAKSTRPGSIWFRTFAWQYLRPISFSI